MSTVKSNKINLCEINGTFDDCQNIVKDILADNEFSGKCCDDSSVSGGNGCACITKEQQCYLNSRGGNRTSDSEY